MKTALTVIVTIITAVWPTFGADMFPAVDEKPIAELALKAVIAHRPELKTSDLKMTGIECRYFYNNDFIPDDGAAYKHANAIVTFIIVSTRKESIQNKERIADYEALQVIFSPELSPTQMKVKDTRITFTRGI